MSRNTQADALPQWVYILVVTLLIPFAIILTLALTGMNVSDTWTMVASTCILVAITFISHVRWPMFCVWIDHLASSLIFLSTALILYNQEEPVQGAFAMLMSVMDFLTLIAMAYLARKEIRGWKIFRSKKAFLLGQTFIGYVLLFLLIGIAMDVIPGMTLLATNIREALIEIFAITYPLGLWTAIHNHGEGEVQGKSKNTERKQAKGRKGANTSLYVRKDIIRYSKWPTSVMVTTIVPLRLTADPMD